MCIICAFKVLFEGFLLSVFYLNGLVLEVHSADSICGIHCIWFSVCNPSSCIFSGVISLSCAQ